MSEAATPRSDFGYMMSDAPRSSGARRPHNPSSSAGRPRAPPSESNGHPSDDEGDGFADDQVPNRARRPDQVIPRVEDRVGLAIQDHFQNFIEQYVPRICTALRLSLPCTSFPRPRCTVADTQPCSPLQVHRGPFLVGAHVKRRYDKSVLRRPDPRYEDISAVDAVRRL